MNYEMKLNKTKDDRYWEELKKEVGFLIDEANIDVVSLSDPEYVKCHLVGTIHNHLWKRGMKDKKVSHALSMLNRTPERSLQIVVTSLLDDYHNHRLEE